MTESQPPTGEQPEPVERAAHERDYNALGHLLRPGTVEQDPGEYERAVKNLLKRGGRDPDDAGLRGDDRTQRWGVALKAIPGYMAALRRVPPNYWTEEFEEAGEVHLARVRCTCGADVLVEEGGKRECGGEECERIFIYLGRDKLYVLSPLDRESDDDRDAS